VSTVQCVTENNKPHYGDKGKCSIWCWTSIKTVYWSIYRSLAIVRRKKHNYSRWTSLLAK